MAVELNALRDQIDAVDKQMLELLAQRLALVEKVGGEVKSEHGLPIYAPDREAAMLASRRAEAEKMGIPPQLIEDILRRTMRESYASEKDSGFKCLNLIYAQLLLLVVMVNWVACLGVCSNCRATRSKFSVVKTGIMRMRF